MKVLVDRCLLEGMDTDCVEYIDFFGERPYSNNQSIKIDGNFEWYTTEYIKPTETNINFTRYDCNTENETLKIDHSYNSTYLLNSTVQLNIGAKLRDLLKFPVDSPLWDASTNEFQVNSEEK